MIIGISILSSFINGRLTKLLLQHTILYDQSANYAEKKEEENYWVSSRFTSITGEREMLFNHKQQLLKDLLNI